MHLLDILIANRVKHPPHGDKILSNLPVERGSREKQNHAQNDDEKKGKWREKNEEKEEEEEE